MKKLPYLMTSAMDRELAQHRANKRKAVRQLRAGKKTDGRAAAIFCLVTAAKSVVANWENHDLAECVRNLDHAIEDYEEAFK